MPHLGVVSECLSIIEFPSTIGGITSLKGSQTGKLYGIIAVRTNIFRLDFVLT